MDCFEQRSEREITDYQNQLRSVLKGLEENFRDALELNADIGKLADEDDMKYWLERIEFARILVGRIT